MTETAKRVVLRYQLSPSTKPQELIMPADAEILSVGIRPGDLRVSLWALCRCGEHAPVARLLWCVGTGPDWEMPADLNIRHVGTAIEQTATSWHVFEEVQS